MLMTSCGGYKIRSSMGNFHITVPAAKSSAVKMFRDMRKRGSRHTYTDVHLEHTYIASCVRQQTKVGPDGNLLRAHKDIEGKSKIAVNFTGTDFDGSVAFQVGKSERFSANTFRCCLDNQQYYLCADEKEVFLLKADTGEPNYDERVMFKIEKASRRYRTIKSVKTGMFLASNEFGRASMRLLSETPQDRQAWFELIELDMDVTCDSILTTTGDVTYKEETSEFECKIHDYHVPVDTQGAMIIGQGRV